MKINKLLVANRGEIALRVMRSAKEMGIQTVAVFSEADRNALHVRFADEAYLLGPAPSAESYLKGQKIIEVAKNCGAQAIHPGYGFLSENAAFARAVEAAGLLFVGPSAHAIDIMGSKLAAKEAVAKFDVPLVPGTPGAIANASDAIEYCNKIGYPVLIKASAGGGGKGMRIVEQESELDEQMARAIGEATSAFGDGSVFIEKYIGSPRHIEIQILGDQHGNVVYLFERDCSVQRRHQKVIEEAPSGVLTPELRKQMGEAAVQVAKSVGYYNAGTVEFILSNNMEFYFLEMNTRLQVEHPVTEMITGLDLVKEQIKIAEGKPLSFAQEDLKIHGHAIEIRVYAEDPSNNFLPDTGTLQTYVRPQGPGVRVDDGMEQGQEIPIYYDPMISKLIVHASTREEAIERMIRAIDEYHVTGVATTLPFCKMVMQHPVFRNEWFDTHFVQKYFKPEILVEPLTEDEKTAIAAVAALLSGSQPAAGSTVISQNNSKEQVKFAGKSAWQLNRL